MDGELWDALYPWIVQVDSFHQQTPAKFSDAKIVTTYFWSVLHDRPVYWACDKNNWPESWRQQPLPSQPTMSRRLKHYEGVRRFLLELEQLISSALYLVRFVLLSLLDGKPLPVSRHSTDPDADFGRGAGGKDKGYKLHTLWYGAPLPLWEVRPMNIAEPTVALRLVNRLEEGGGYVLADKGYDSNPLHTHCQQKGRQLIAPPRQSKGAGCGHRQQSPARLHALEMIRRPMGLDLRKLRWDVERCLGNLTSFGGGLSPLPAWVRRLTRVRRWVQAKLILNALRIQHVLERQAA